MKIAVLAFGVAKEMVGGSSTALEMKDGDTVVDIKTALESSHPRLKQLSSFAIAVNGGYAAGDVVVKPGDEVAIIPPVSGG